ncbi:hypothetical protein GCM10025857_08670 [Alicyclobacillus contaminans]|uniref:glycosyltransferase family protein n=1 Tax=Alicyclobacillus contaminans TaxID=392016 RepID=UPI0003F6D49D|nr:glycosyltransferase [Alicyclobacillus contaminans]GMA49510.1 hypothetical protein GCM10025857_08670 [Alicyclobacillus contaminans]
MRVVHGPIEIAGQMGILSKGLQDRGITSAAYNNFHTYLGYRDYIHNVDAFEIEYLFPDVLEYFDAFHFHYASTMLPEFRDLPYIKALGKPMVMHHWGNDVRTHAVASRNNPYVYTGDSPPPEQVHQTLTALSSMIDHAIVQDYEVYSYVSPYYKHVHILPIAMDVTARAPSYPSTLETTPLILHAPTNPAFKGTIYVEAAVERLRVEGFPIRYRRIEQMSNAEALALYREADIVVDQILCGSYGMLAVEAMSLGKPVIGFIREDLKPLYPEVPPIVSANPANIYEVLKQLVTSPLLRHQLGEQGRRYVEKYHHLPVVIERLLDIYRAAGAVV